MSHYVRRQHNTTHVVSFWSTNYGAVEPTAEAATLLTCFFDNEAEATTFANSRSMPPEMAMLLTVEEYLRNSKTSFDYNGWIVDLHIHKMGSDRWGNNVRQFDVYSRKNLNETTSSFRVLFRPQESKGSSVRQSFRVKRMDIHHTSYINGSFYFAERDTQRNCFSLAGFEVYYGDGDRLGKPTHYKTGEQLDIGDLLMHEDPDMFIPVMTTVLQNKNVWTKSTKDR